MVTDEICIEKFTDENGNISLILKQSIYKNFSEIKKYIENRFVDTKDACEVIFRIKNKIYEVPKCYCGNNLKFNKKLKRYNKYCSYKCQNSDIEKINKDKATKKEKYGSENYNNIKKQKETCLLKYGTEFFSKTKEFLEKVKKTNIEKYGVEYFLSSDEIKQKSKRTKKEKYGSETYNNREKAKQTNTERYGVENTKQWAGAKEKEKETCLKKYGVTSYSKTEESKEKHKKTFIKHYGVSNNTKSEEWKEKWYGNKDWVRKRSENIYNSMKKNGSFKESKTEKIILEYLQAIYPDVIYQYKDEIRYPFKCDFYIPSKDVFIEYNGYWTHGKHPFNPKSDEDLAILEKWRSKNKKHYNVAIRVWTKDDILKREYVNKNNLNYIELKYEDYLNLDSIVKKIESINNE